MSVPVEGKDVPLVLRGDVPPWVPPEVAQQLYPASADRLNPEARQHLPSQGDATKSVESAEIVGARAAFRKVAFLPMALVVIFGLIAIYDKIRGGYKAVMLSTADPGDFNARRPRPSWPHDMRR